MSQQRNKIGSLAAMYQDRVYLSKVLQWVRTSDAYGSFAFSSSCI